MAGPYVARVSTWAELTRGFDSAEDAASSVIAPSYLYRGQALAEWTLKPSLTRIFERSGLQREERAQALERDFREIFKARVHEHLDLALLPAENDLLSWWVIMQHYGAPTRVLDWTESPYVALYFAVCSHPGSDGAVWV